MGCPLFLAEMVFIFILLSRLGRLTTLEHDCFVYILSYDGMPFDIFRQLWYDD